MTLTWEEAEVAALTDEKWRQSVAQCVHFDAGWIKVSVTYKWTLTCIITYIRDYKAGGGGVSEQCFTSPPTQYRLYGRRFLQVKRPNQHYQSTEGDATREKENNENN